MSDPTHYLKKELDVLLENDPDIQYFVRQWAQDGIWYRDLESLDAIWISPDFWRSFGYDPSTRPHQMEAAQNLIHPEDLRMAETNLSRHLNDAGHPYDQVVRYMRADGQSTWVRCRGRAIRDERNRAVRMLFVHGDLSESVDARSATQTVSFLNLVMDTAESGIIGLDRTGKITAANPRARHILGGISTEVPFPWPSDVAFLDRELFLPLKPTKSPVERALSGETIRGEITVMNRKTGADLRYVRVSTALARPAHASLHAVMVIDDISEQEKNRQAVERSSRLDALGQLTGGIAHDFNNLLATIQYALQLANSEQEPQRRTTYIETALSSVDRGSELTRRLLAFAKHQPGLAKSREIGPIIDDFAKLARPVIEEHIAMDFDRGEGNMFVFCDPSQLENAMLNLVLNSRDAIRRSGIGDKILVQVRGVAELGADTTLLKEDPHSFVAAGLQKEYLVDRGRDDGSNYRYVEVAVTDNGPGMPAEVKRRAVDPFFTTKGNVSGTGLGLSMVYGFVQQSGGQLRIYSELSRGTTVRLILPRGTPEGLREQPVEKMPAPVGSGERILLVEDEQELLAIMRDLIKSLGYDIISASSGPAVLDILEDDVRIDLMLTDIVMPGGMSGFELARKVRSRRPDLPIVYMSGYTGFSADDMGGVIAPMLQKPAPPGELAVTLHTALGARVKA